MFNEGQEPGQRELNSNEKYLNRGERLEGVKKRTRWDAVDLEDETGLRIEGQQNGAFMPEIQGHNITPREAVPIGCRSTSIP